jgi:hypothetical protein
MRTETETTNIYTFEELSPEARQKALDRLYDLNVDHDWWDCTYDDATEIGCKINGFDIGRASECDLNFTLSACEVAQNILNNHGEACETYKTTEQFMEEWQPVYNEYPDKEGYELEDQLMDIEEEYRKALSEDYLAMLRREYEYLTSEEAIIETIEANEYEFTEDGSLYHA